ncbi:MAG: AAA family ATPase [Kiritimatiellae bacterium]|nr:AAA family ATPase [Kiritimatiellia bacterium]
MARMIEDYERELIGTLLMRPERTALAVEEGCAAAWFSSDAWSLVWSAVEAFWKRGEIESITPVTALAEAQRIAALPKEPRDAAALTVAKLQDAIDNAAADPSPALRLLKNAATERAAKDAIAKSFKDFPLFANSADVVLDARNKLDAVLARIGTAKKITPRAVMDEILAEYTEAHRKRVAKDGPRDLKWTPGIKMPWPKMTAIMNGLRAGLHIIAARPSIGKTSFAVNLMRYWCEGGAAVVFCSLDMPRVEVMRRFVAEKSRVSARKASFSPTRADLDAMHKAADAVAAWPLSVVETRDVDDLRVHCAVERAAGRLDVLVIDYLQLLHARALAKEDAIEYARVSYVSDTLKRLANDLHIPVVALAQLNREVAKQDAQGRMPGLADLRGSGSIEQDAFTVAILHRDARTVEKWRKGEDIERAKRLIPGTVDNPSYRYNFDDLDPVWWVLCKAQNGPTSRLPFVVRKKYFAWMLGDYDARPKTESSGYGATAKTVEDLSPYFERVHSDWRHDALEEVLRLQLALIQDPDVVEIGADD